MSDAVMNDPYAPIEEPVKEEPKKKKKGGKLLLILLPIILILAGGGVFAAGYFGLVKTPWTPAKKSSTTTKADAAKKGTAAPLKAAEAPPKPVVKKRPVAPAPTKKDLGPTLDPEKGAKSIAKVWAAIPTEKLLPIVLPYRDLDLARILNKMDAKKSALLLAEMDPARAGKVSLEMERLARIVPPEEKL